MQANVSVKGVNRVNLRLTKMAERAQDFAPVFRWAQRELEQANRDNFRSRGATSGEPWMPLDDEYARWKLAHHGPKPPMVLSGRLFRDVTWLKGPPNSIGRLTATFGTNLPYAKFHEAGTRDMPARNIMFVPRLFAQRLSERMGKYIVYGNMQGVSVRRARGLFER